MFSCFFYDNFLAKLSPLPPKSFQSVSLELVHVLVVTDLAVFILKNYFSGDQGTAQILAGMGMYVSTYKPVGVM